MRRLLLFALGLLLSGAASADLYVTVNGAGTQDGTSLANACAGGAAGTADADCATFTDGQTVRFCDTFTQTITIPNAGTDASTKNIYTCECPGGTNGRVLVSTGDGFLNNKAFAEVVDCPVSGPGSNGNGIFIAANDTAARRNVIRGFNTGTGNSIEIQNAATRDNIEIEDNDMEGSATQSLLYTYGCAAARDLTDISIVGNRFGPNLAGQAILLTHTANTAGCSIKRVRIAENRIVKPAGDAIVVQSAPTTVVNEDIIVEDNECNGGTGCIAVYAFGSSTGTYGKNAIRRNTCRETTGVTGCINPFYNEWFDVDDNDAFDLTTTGIDGNHVLIDHGNNHVRVRRNVCDGLAGGGVANSGVCLMVLDSQDVLLEANIGMDVASMFYFSGAGVENDIVARHNSGWSRDYGAYIDSAMDAAALTFVNNALVTDGTGILAESTAGAPDLVDFNSIKATTNYTLNGVFSAGANDLLGSPLWIGGDKPVTAEGFRLTAASPLRGKGVYARGARDFTVRKMGVPANIGAFGQHMAASRRVAPLQ